MRNFAPIVALSFVLPPTFVFGNLPLNPQPRLQPSRPDS